MILAFDPGKNIGIALVDRQGNLHEHAIVDDTQVSSLEISKGTTLLVGNGTGSTQLQRVLRKRKLDFTLVDETGTSLQARELYWQHHKPRGWQRLLPKSLRVISQLDDMAAYAIALRWLDRQET